MFATAAGTASSRALLASTGAHNLCPTPAAHSNAPSATTDKRAASHRRAPVLLILDLGRPHLFINMLRVFKPQSAMSMGAWILAAFGMCVVPGLIALELQTFHLFAGAIDQILGVAAGILMFGSAIFGMLLATYTGVLIGATAIPAWFLHHRLLPIHFGTAGLGSAAALLELLGHRIAPLNAIGLFAAAVETVLLIWLSIDKHGVADRAIHEHGSGWLIRIGEVFTGPIPLVLRFFGAIPLAAISFLLGALVSRFGWIAVGKISGRDPESVFASQKLAQTYLAVGQGVPPATAIRQARRPSAPPATMARYA